MPDSPLLTRSRVIQEARGLLGAPYAHLGRSVGGVDCGGLCALVASRVGYDFKDLKQYSRIGHGHLVPYLRTQLDEVESLDYAEPGDIGVMWFDRHTKEPQHVFIFTELDWMIHATIDSKRVVEVPINARSRLRITNVFRFRGIE